MNSTAATYWNLYGILDKYNISSIMLQEISVILSLFVVQILTPLSPTGNQITNPPWKVFASVLFCFFQGFIKDCPIEGTEGNEKFRTLHNDKVVADLHHATLLSVRYIICYLIVLSSWSILRPMTAYYFNMGIPSFHPCHYKLQIRPPWIKTQKSYSFFFSRAATYCPFAVRMTFIS